MKFISSLKDRVEIKLSANYFSPLLQTVVQKRLTKYSGQLAVTCSKLTKEALEQGVKYVQTVFSVNFKHISHLVLVLVFLLLSLWR